MSCLPGLEGFRGPYTRQIVRKSKAEGRKEGIKEGEVKGDIQGRQQALLTVLSARGLALSATIRDRILSCSDAATLDRWIARATRARSAARAIAD
jgi:hypothetical protein